MNEVEVGVLQKLRQRISQRLFPRGIQQFEITVRSGDTKQIQRQAEQLLQMLFAWPRRSGENRFKVGALALHGSTASKRRGRQIPLAAFYPIPRHRTRQSAGRSV